MTSSQKASYNWTSNLDVGNEQLNDEHKTLLAKMAKVEEFNERMLSKEALLEAYDDLVQYAVDHFKEEEAYMREILYPAAETHGRIHSALIDALAKYRAEFMASVYARFPAAVFDFFKTWMLTHIMIVDRQYSEYADAKARVRTVA
jgi:hemerythrin-like metal-binding protein